ncbi:MAG: nitroreductase family protein, partial [Candidatus Helarchaeota archaeon]|nr:nitroreductase family protein [Candidatus Helarchaeota archaeon]
MPIIGIDIEKCTNCKQCIRECPSAIFETDEAEGLVIFNPSKICIYCGHCISVCPENAILYKKMKDEALSFDGVQDPSTLISYEQMYHLIRAKRSIRQYKKKKVPKEIIKKVINSMRYAPTGANIRQMKCLIISDEEKIKTLSKLIQNELQSTMPAVYTKSLNDKRAMSIDPIFYEAPHIIILYSGSTSDYANALIAMTYGMFCAETLGLGTC